MWSLQRGQWFCETPHPYIAEGQRTGRQEEDMQEADACLHSDLLLPPGHAV
jgi:hypothetical protein